MGTLRSFNDRLNGAQLILAVLIYRMVETERRRREAPRFLPYASNYLAMLIGQELLLGLGLKRVDDLTHKNFAAAQAFLEENRDRLYGSAVDQVQEALKDCRLPEEVSLQRLSGAFRGTDLLHALRRKSG